MTQKHYRQTALLRWKPNEQTIEEISGTDCLIYRQNLFYQTSTFCSLKKCILNFFYARQHIAVARMPRQFRLSVCPSVRTSVSLSHACIVSKWLNVPSKFFHHLIGPSFYFFVTKGHCINLRASPPTGAPNTRVVAIFDQYAAISRKR